MSKLTDQALNIKGESGLYHKFHIYELSHHFDETWKGVYIFLKYEEDNSKIFYINNSDKFNECFDSHEYLGKAVRLGADSIGIFLKENEQEMIKVKNDLAYKIEKVR